MGIGVKALLQHCDRKTGLWDTEGWWNAANSTMVLGDAIAVDPSVVPVATLQNTFSRAQDKFAKFRNEFYDDEGWWGLAWIQAFGVTHQGA
jgi:hypothetical protein